MIQDVDESLRAIIRRDALAGTEVEVALDAPTREWAARRNSPTLDMYLYDIREDLRRRENGLIDVRDNAGRITARRRPPRYYKLSYLVTAWTQRPEDEHRLLSAVLACFLRQDSLPPDILVGRLRDTTLPVAVTIALPPPEDRALSDVWSAMGGELKPSLDLVVTAPFEAGPVDLVAGLVLEELRLDVGMSAHPDDPVNRRGRRETVVAGHQQQKGRIFHFTDITRGPEPAGADRDGANHNGGGHGGGDHGGGDQGGGDRRGGDAGGPKDGSPKDGGPKTSGPRTSNPRTSGPKTSGPKTSGPKGSRG